MWKKMNSLAVAGRFTREITMARICVLLVLMAAYSPHVIAQAPHIFGSWTLNADDSVYPGDLPRSQVRTYVPLEGEFYVGLAVTIDSDGNASFLQFTAKTDGQDYPEYGVFSLALLQMSDLPTTTTYSESQIDEYTVEWADKSDGETYLSGTRQVSTDGSRLTISFSAPDENGEGVDYLLVYDRPVQ